MRRVASILRLHILLIAVAGTLTFGWLFTGRYLWAIAALAGIDWLLINLFNRTTDLTEDLANRIPGTELVARRRRTLLWLCCGVLVGSFCVSVPLFPEVSPWRLAVLAMGFAYSHRVLPTAGKPARLKDLYLVKNLASSLGFVITVFLYPLAHAGWQPLLPGGAAAVVWLAVFFVAFELTYEILYDLRDVEGDRLAGVPTFAVVHGPEGARRILDGLLVLSGLSLAAGFASGVLGARETLMLAAPAAQFAYYRPRYRRGLTSADCVRVTHLGTAMLILYLVGTRLWLWAGLPENAFL